MKIKFIKFSYVGLFTLLLYPIAAYSTKPAVFDTGVTVCLQSIPTILAPEILDDKVMYTIRFVFDTCPEDNWVYYSPEKKELIIDFYGVHIFQSPGVVLKGAAAIRGMEVKNSQVSMALNGRRSQIILTLDSYWNYESSQISDKVLRLNIWKSLDSVATLKKKRGRSGIPLLVLLISFSTAAITILLLTFFNKSD